MLRPTHIKITESDRKAVVTVLNQQLANLSDLASQTKQAHWNVMGTNFFSLHKLFEEISGLVDGDIDDLAERITTLGGVANGTVRLAAKASLLPDLAPTERDGNALITALVERFGITANSAREGIDIADSHNDLVTADLLTEITAKLDKGLWLLESSLKHDG